MPKVHMTRFQNVFRLECKKGYYRLDGIKFIKIKKAGGGNWSPHLKGSGAKRYPGGGKGITPSKMRWDSTKQKYVLKRKKRKK